ncbi:hypothetical protein MTBSS4_110047 [Magnetospirillum sp. SS-4]|nr:hypothetical protein MTBSS4_110047 [Magnetospirillum sp. SS-4]
MLILKHRGHNKPFVKFPFLPNASDHTEFTIGNIGISGADFSDLLPQYPRMPGKPLK